MSQSHTHTRNTHTHTHTRNTHTHATHTHTHNLSLSHTHCWLVVGMETNLFFYLFFFEFVIGGGWGRAAGWLFGWRPPDGYAAVFVTSVCSSDVRGMCEYIHRHVCVCIVSCACVYENSVCTYIVPWCLYMHGLYIYREWERLLCVCVFINSI